MDPQNRSFEAQLEQLRHEYEKSLPQKLAEIRNTWEKILNTQSTNAAEAMGRITHLLAGSGSTFGYTQLSTIAKELEYLVWDLRTKNLWHDPTHVAKINLHIDDLSEAAKKQDPAEPVVFDTNLPEKPLKAHRQDLQRVYWVGTNGEFAQQVKKQLRYYYFEVSVFESAGQCIGAAGKEPPLALIVDATVGNAGDLQPLLEAVQPLANQYPSIFISSFEQDDSLPLACIRAGAAACFSKPLRIFSLVSKLDSLIYTTTESSYRVLIVDDDTVLASHIATIMGKAGMKTRVLNEPGSIMKTLREFKPDLVLMDLYLENCSGLELGKLIRQNDGFVSIPIVYMSSEREVNHKLAALDLGADDFLLKPIQYRYLCFSLMSRIRRARRLKSFMAKDQLTGLWNHTEIYKRLRVSLGMTRKNKGNLTAAILNIDGFHRINQQYGYDRGDEVLRSLAKVLERRSRKHGWAGRFGGDEFAMILPGKTKAQATRFLEKVRENFSAILHGQGEQAPGFTANISCGLASFPQFISGGSLIEEARRNMIKAKSHGGGQVWQQDQGQSSKGKDQPRPALQAASIDLAQAEASRQPPEDQITAPGIMNGKQDRGKIVIVDDERNILTLISSQLSEEGYEVVGASTGDEGLALAQEHQPKLILTDLLLFPGIHGFELCRKVRRDPSLKKTKIIAMTSVYKNYRYRLEAKEAGADSFIEKPIDFPELLQKIHGLGL